MIIRVLRTTMPRSFTFSPSQITRMDTNAYGLTFRFVACELHFVIIAAEHYNKTLLSTCSRAESRRGTEGHRPQRDILDQCRSIL